MLDDSIWDENRWEAFLREQDERIERFMRQINRFIMQDPPPRPEEEGSLAEWELRLKAYLQSRGWEMGEIEMKYFEDEAEDEVGFVLGKQQDYLEEEYEIEDVDGTLDEHPLYLAASALSQEIQEWADALPGAVKDSTLVQFCMHVMQIVVNIAKGHDFGVELEMLGGHIACAKRALSSANESLSLLSDLKGKAYMDEEYYFSLYESLYELRNEIGLYIQELRGRFNLGID